MGTGYDSPLYVLPFDHRATFSKTMFGWEGPLSTEQTRANHLRQGGDFRRLQGRRGRRCPQGTGRDPRGRDIRCEHPSRRREAGVHHRLPRGEERARRIRFEYGPDFARHIEEFNPTFCKVLVRYNPDGDDGLNRHQADRLKQLSGLPACARPAVHVRAARAPRTRPVAEPRQRQEGVRSPASPRR